MKRAHSGLKAYRHAHSFEPQSLKLAQFVILNSINCIRTEWMVDKQIDGYTYVLHPTSVSHDSSPLPWCMLMLAPEIMPEALSHAPKAACKVVELIGYLESKHNKATDRRNTLYFLSASSCDSSDWKLASNRELHAPHKSTIIVPKRQSLTRA